MKKLLFWFLVVCPAITNAQDTTRNIGFYTTLSVGLAAGESNAEPVYQLSTGFLFQRFYAGAGIGIDRYKFRTYPLFADLRYDFDRRKSAFVYANIGYDLIGKQEKRFTFNQTADDYIGGFYFDAGIGYRFAIGHHNGIAFSAGYSGKDLVNEKRYLFAWQGGDCDEQVVRNRYKLTRVLMKLSWQFNSRR